MKRHRSRGGFIKINFPTGDSETPIDDRQNVEYIGARRTQLNGIDVVDAVGRYTDAELGLMLVRITGFVHPTKPKSVYSVVNLVASHYEITNMVQMFLTGSGKTLEKFEYLD